MNIGIIGLGIVGKAVAAYHGQSMTLATDSAMGQLNDSYDGKVGWLFTYDKATDSQEALDRLNQFADVVFICVNTPYGEPGKGLDCSNVYDAVSKLTGEKCVVIKSTVMPGTTDDLQAKYPQHRFFFVPEFLSELTAVEDYANPRRPHVIGHPNCEPVDMDWIALLPPCGHEDELVGGVFYDDAPILLPARQAELLKLLTNAFYALKVTFFNQAFDCGATQGMLDALAADPWIGDSHSKVEHKNYRGFAGPCLLKDTKALVDLAELTKFPLALSADIYNTSLLESQGVEWRKWLGKR